MNGTSTQEVAKMIAGRFDYILGAGDQAQHEVDVLAPDKRDLVKISFADMSPGAARHFMCSLAVDATTIARLNAAIQSLHLDIEHEEH